MSFKFLNQNPDGLITDDCTVRAIALVMNKDWDTIFIGLVALAFEEKTMPDNNTLWTKYLINNGFERTAIPNFCQDCSRLMLSCTWQIGELWRYPPFRILNFIQKQQNLRIKFIAGLSNQ